MRAFEIVPKLIARSYHVTVEFRRTWTKTGKIFLFSPWNFVIAIVLFIIHKNSAQRHEERSSVKRSLKIYFYACPTDTSLKQNIVHFISLALYIKVSPIHCLEQIEWEIGARPLRRAVASAHAGADRRHLQRDCRGSFDRPGDDYAVVPETPLPRACSRDAARAEISRSRRLVTETRLRRRVSSHNRVILLSSSSPWPPISRVECIQPRSTSFAVQRGFRRHVGKQDAPIVRAESTVLPIQDEIEEARNRSREASLTILDDKFCLRRRSIRRPSREAIHGKQYWRVSDVSRAYLLRLDIVHVVKCRLEETMMRQRRDDETVRHARSPRLIASAASGSDSDGPGVRRRRFEEIQLIEERGSIDHAFGCQSSMIRDAFRERRSIE